MTDEATGFTAFAGHTRVAHGTKRDIALALRARMDAGDSSLVLVFADADGRQLDVDFRGSAEEVAARYPQEAEGAGAAPPVPTRRPRGRPRLGVVGKEVTLLPRHWDWLEKQRGGSSATLRRLVDEARAATRTASDVRAAQDAVHRSISVLAGDLPGFEEATRALYRGNRGDFEERARDWPRDVVEFIARWLDAAFAQTSMSS